MHSSISPDYPSLLLEITCSTNNRRERLDNLSTHSYPFSLCLTVKNSNVTRERGSTTEIRIDNSPTVFRSDHEINGTAGCFYEKWPKNDRNRSLRVEEYSRRSTRLKLSICSFKEYDGKRALLFFFFAYRDPSRKKLLISLVIFSGNGGISS